MGMFILAVLLLAAGITFLKVASKRRAARAAGDGLDLVGKLPKYIGAALLVLGGFAFLPSVLYSQGAGQANVIVNFGGSVAGVDVTTGWGVKAPWQRTEEWDLRNIPATYAGSGDSAPSYTNGVIQGNEVTVSLGRVQPNVDIQFSYSLEPNVENLKRLYNEYRTQESFTQQVIQPVLLSSTREAPSNVRPLSADEQDEDAEETPEIAQTPGVLTPVQFRGEYRDDVAAEIRRMTNLEFEDFFVVVERVELQDIRFSTQVEESLVAVEAAQQRVQEAEANLRATEIEAQAQVVQAEQGASAAIAKATGEAEANRLLAASLTPEIIESRRIEALKEAGAVYVVPDGSTPFVQIQK